MIKKKYVEITSKQQGAKKDFEDMSSTPPEHGYSGVVQFFFVRILSCLEQRFARILQYLSQKNCPDRHCLDQVLPGFEQIMPKVLALLLGPSG